MRKTIVRKIVQSTIKSIKIDLVDDKPITTYLPDEVVNGKISMEKAVKHLKKIHGKQSNIYIQSVTVDENTYEISVDDFIKNAKIIEKN